MFGPDRYSESMERAKDQQPITSNSFISTPATVLQRRIPLVMSGLLLLVVLGTVPYAHQMLPHVPPFIAFYCALALFADLITAYLLFGQFFRMRSPSLLALATAYLFSSLIVLPYTLTFPGIFSATGLFQAGTQTTNWLWIFWHTGFPLGILFSILLHKKQGGSQIASHQLSNQFLLVLILLPLVIVLLSIVAITSDSFLPILIVNGDYTRLITSGVGPAILVIAGCVWIASLFQARHGTLLHIWLSVAALAWLVDVFLNLFAGSRYSLGWYVGRINSMIAATVVLCALLYQVTRLYAQVVDQNEQLEEQNKRLQEARNLEEQNLLLQEANRLKTEFLANMSHELRTPLNGIIGFAEMMYDGEVEDPAEQHEWLGDILSSAQHLLQLINDVLDLSKIEAGKIHFSPESVDLPRLVEEVQDVLRLLINQKRICFGAEVDATLTNVMIDPARLKQVLYNYLSNALKFTPDGGEVTVRIVSEGEDTFLVEVEDSGKGIAPADLERLFVAFQQLDAGTAKKYQGTGLGLALTKRIVEAQGGRVGVCSVVGRGSTFSALLPRVDTTIEEQAEQKRPVEWAHPLVQLHQAASTILVIEDDPGDRSSLVKSLVAAGYAVEAATTAAEASEQYEKRTFDMIMLDLLLPDASGWDVLRKLRAGGPNCDTPVIVVTLVAEKNVAMGLPIQGLFSKPIHLEELLASVEQARRK